MVEYIFDAIKATSGQDNEITAIITDDDGNYITEGCKFMLHDKNGSVLSLIEGECRENLWYFTIPAKDTQELKGRYWYCIGCATGNLCFMKPFYLY